MVSSDITSEVLGHHIGRPRTLSIFPRKCRLRKNKHRTLVLFVDLELFLPVHSRDSMTSQCMSFEFEADVISDTTSCLAAQAMQNGRFFFYVLVQITYILIASRAFGKECDY